MYTGDRMYFDLSQPVHSASARTSRTIDDWTRESEFLIYWSDARDMVSPDEREREREKIFQRNEVARRLLQFSR